jgi:hypothetical protein
MLLIGRIAVQSRKISDLIPPMRYGTKEFEEIANCGGTVTFTIRTSEDGRRSYQVGFSGSRPVPMVLIGIYIDLTGAGAGFRGYEGCS